MSNPRIPRKKGQPAKSKKHSDLYTDEDPKGTIHGLGFKDVATSKASVSKIRKSSRSHAHKIQAAIAMEQRARVMGKTAEAAIYRSFINSMKKKTKKMNEENVEEGWSDKYKKSIDCNNPKGFSQKAHCQGKKKKMNEDRQIKKIVKQLRKSVKSHAKQADTLEKKITEGSLHKWFKGSKSKDGKGGWVNVVTGGTCASDEPGEGTPKCVSSAKRASMSKKERLSAARRKKKADPNQQAKSGAAKPTYVSTDSPRKKKMKESYGGTGVSRKARLASTHPPTAQAAIKNIPTETDRGSGNKAKRRAGMPVEKKSPTYKAYMTNKEEVSYFDLPLEVEIPSNLRDFNKGLMFRESLENNKGMLFIFERVGRYSFYMKNTTIPLDVAFVTEDGIIDSIKELEPNDETPVASEGEVIFAIEVNRGWFAENNVEVGDELVLGEAKDKKGKGSGTKDACYHKVKSRYSVWPSAYASGALVKCRKVGAANWGNKSESVEMKNYLDKKAKKLDKQRSAQPDRYKNNPAFDSTSPNSRSTDLARTRAEEVQRDEYGDPVGGPKISKKQRAKNLASNTPDEKNTTTSEAVLDEKKAQKCWPGYEKKGTKMMFGKRYNNCVKKEQFSNWRDELGYEGKDSSKKIEESHYGKSVNKIPKELDKAVALHKSQAERLRKSPEFKKDAGKNANKIPDQLDKAVAMHTKQAKQLRDAGVGEKNCGCGKTPCKTYGKQEVKEGKSPAWQRKEGKSESGGLNAKGVASYRRANPGSKLKTAVTTKPSKLKKGSKAAKRRKSFCARMKGMKKRLTSAKTARDPDSRINKSLRKWNCSYEPTGTTIAEKALSKKQQRFFGIVRAAQKGTLDGEASPQVQRAAADMKMKDVKKFASTKHKGLPEKVKSEE